MCDPGKADNSIDIGNERPAKKIHVNRSVRGRKREFRDANGCDQSVSVPNKLDTFVYSFEAATPVQWITMMFSRKRPPRDRDDNGY